MKIFTLLLTILFATTLNKSNSQCTLPANLPYIQDFQACTPPDLPPCTINQTIPVHRTTFKWITAGFPSDVFANVYVDEPDANGNMWLYLPMMYFDATKSYSISYKYKSDNPNPLSAPTFSVYFGTCNVNTCMTNLITTGVVSNTGYLIASQNYAPPASGNYYIGFNHKDKPGFPGYSTALDSIVVQVNDPLPVILSPLSFQNSNGSGNLLWKTYSEQNNQKFEILQSADGTQFQPIGQVASKAANGNSQNILPYEFTIPQSLLSSGYFFRLKQIDRDGKSSYSNIIKTGNFIGSGRKISINGNPVNDMLYVTARSEKVQKVELKISDQSGRQVYKNTTQFKNGINQLQENLKAISNGIYYLVIIDQQGRPIEAPLIFTKQ